MNELIKKIVVSVFVAVNLSVLAVGSYWVYISTIGYDFPKVTEKSLREPASLKEKFGDTPMIYTMDKFTVNLSGLPKRTIRVQVNLDMISPVAFQEIMDFEYRAKARDKIVKILTDKTVDDLESIQGKLFLKDKIVAEVNQILHKGLVKDVYFTDFVMN
ncbi:MAG: flagellar protein FliL [Pseudobdellovibrio sp.]|jgi:flagellar FliL protein|nr:flagellar protein FliL [Pseudobdellovibrio sp.]